MSAAVVRARRFLAVLCLGAAAGAAADCQLAAGSQMRWYQHDRQVASSYDSLASVTMELECDQRFAGGAQSFSTKLYARAAQHDSGRTYADVRELVWVSKHDPWQLRIGVDQVFWGVTEFAHVVDVINQSDMLEEPFGDSKVGQPMASLSVRQDWGTVTLFGLPWFRERVYPDLDDRLRSAPRLEFGNALFESSREREHFDWALRYSHVIGAMDIGLSYFDGTSRDPVRTLLPGPGGSLELHPYYRQIEQFGLDLQLTLGEWLLKFEGAQRHATGLTREAYTVGVEYALVGLAGTPADINLVLEYVHDPRFPLPVPEFLQDDWSLGFRLALNDERSTEARFGVIYDPGLSSQGWALDLSSRIAGQWRLAGEVRVFRRLAPIDPLHTLNGDTYLDVSLTRYF